MLSNKPARSASVSGMARPAAVTIPISLPPFVKIRNPDGFGPYTSTHSPVSANSNWIERSCQVPTTLAALSIDGITIRLPGLDRRSLPGLKWSSQHFEGEVAMTGRRRRSDRSGRAPLSSPGRPVVAGRDQQRRFWAAIAAGMASEDAAVQAGMSQAVGTRLFRKAGGMPPAMFRSSAKPLSGRYLSFAEREEIALLRVQGCSMREVARRLGRTASTISRELRRNAATRSGGLEYRATTAQWHADRSARRPKQAKLAFNAALRTYVEERLAGFVVAQSGAPVPGPAVRWKGRRHGPRQYRQWANAWSPEQIARRLPVDFPDDETMRISHEAIYKALV